MLTPAESFRLGFLTRCADEGLTSAEAEQRAKLASVEGWPIVRHVSGAFETGLGLFTKAPMYAAALGIPAAGAVGALAGYGLAGAGVNMPDKPSDDPDAAAVKHRELVDALRQHTEQIRHRIAAHKRLQPIARGPRLYSP